MPNCVACALHDCEERTEVVLGLRVFDVYGPGECIAHEAKRLGDELDTAHFQLSQQSQKKLWDYCALFSHSVFFFCQKAVY